MPWYATTYPRQPADGAAGLLAALLALLGQNLQHWSVRTAPSGACEAILHTADPPATLELEGVAPIWAECTEDAALQEATRHRAQLQKLPPRKAHPHARKAREEAITYEEAAMDAANAEAIASAPVRFGSNADTLGTCIEPGTYLTATPPTSGVCSYVEVRAVMCMVFDGLPAVEKTEAFNGTYCVNFRSNAEQNVLCARMLELWRSQKEYPDAISDIYVDVDKHENYMTYELKLYLTFLGGEIPVDIFESWSDDEGVHSFRRGAIAPTKRDLENTWNKCKRHLWHYRPWE